MKNLKISQFLVWVLLASLALAACTRSASNGAVPTAAPSTDTAANGEGGGAEVDPTMEAIGTELAAQATETAQAAGGVSGAEVTEIVPTPQDFPTPVPTPETAAPTEVPPAPTAAPTVQAGCANPYTVKQGDWIYKIARDCQVDVQALLAANPGAGNLLQPGQKLNLPGTAAAPAAGCTGAHTVVAGDTLYRLAYTCGLAWEKLAAKNNLAYPYLLHTGDVLSFP